VLKDRFYERRRQLRSKDEASNDESLEPARPQIGKAGENVEDQDTHGILFG
jgi:hypothetical protein